MNKYERAVARFHNSYEKLPNGCWKWTGTNFRIPEKGHLPYGSIWNGTKNQKAHRFSQELFNGPIPEGYFVLHSCDYPPCVNPEHLRSGTAQENVREMMDKRRNNFAKGGEEHHNSKMTAAQVKEARLKYAAGGVTYHQLAAEYGISRGGMSLIISGRHWAPVTAEILAEARTQGAEAAVEKIDKGIFGRVLGDEFTVSYKEFMQLLEEAKKV